MKTNVTVLIVCIFFISISILAIVPDNETSSTDNFVVEKTSTIVKAAIVKSWNSEGSEAIWPDITANWGRYGSTEVSIDDSSLVDIESFTLQDLINNGADVVILGNPSGGNKQYSQGEFQALMDYCSSGHNLLGTYKVFQSVNADNRILAPLFGLNDTIQYYSKGVSPVYYYQDPASYLFNNISEPYISDGYVYSQAPVVGNWITSGPHNAEIVGLTQDTSAIITQYHNGNFWSIYISSMPEYFGDTLDAHFLYNAITFSNQFTKIFNKDNNTEVPHSYFLEQNFPNPFNPITNIRYSLFQAGNINLTIFNELGEKIKTLVNDKQLKGKYQVQWDGKNEAGNYVASGIYICRLKTGTFIQMRKMVLLR